MFGNAVSQRLVSPEAQVVVSNGKPGRRFPWLTVIVAVTGVLVGGAVFYSSYLADAQDPSDASKFDIDSFLMETSELA